MLEALVSSRIRRTLLEYIATHPNDRFYLRGLAKDLSLSVSPLRRELKRLESQGLLTASEEGNMLFYTVNEACPLFAQLQQALLTASAQLDAVSPVGPTVAVQDAETHAVAAHAAVPQQPVVSLPMASTVVSARTVERSRKAWQRARLPMMIGVAAVGLVGMVLAANLAYVAVTNQQLIPVPQQTVVLPRAQAPVVEAKPSTAGAMSGSRWRLMPGAVGSAFAPAPSHRKETY